MQLRLLLLDCTGDGKAFRGLENLPHLACPVSTGSLDSLASLRWALRVLARRAPGLVADIARWRADQPCHRMALHVL